MQHHKVAVIGAGFGGLAALGGLKLAGEHDVIALERSEEVGGTWRDNRYPGCACDVPSHLYSLSFAPNPDWTRAFSNRPEIQRYLEHVADAHGLRESIRFGEEVEQARWDDEAGCWRVRTSTLELTADVLVDASGGLAEPKLPDLPGLDGFEGTVFHSARWRSDHDLRGRRVAVIGTGASSIQFVPEIAPLVDRLLVVQRTAPWVIPRLDRPTTGLERRLYARLPSLQRAPRFRQYAYREAMLWPIMRSRAVRRLVERAARAHLRLGVRDPQLRARLVPDFEIGCKRILISNAWYPALDRDNVDVTSGVLEVRARAVVDADGREHEVDTIIAGTGFEVIHPPVAEKIVGRDGRTLAATWAGRPAGLHATTVAGFPNLFRLGGPGTVTGHTSHVGQIEAQVGYVVDALRTLDAHGARSADPRPDAQAADVAAHRADLAKTVWAVGGCQSWYQDDSGVASANWPRSARRFRRELAHFDPAAYELRADDRVDGEPIVLVTGVGGAAAGWLPILPMLRAAGRRPLVVELPGHGAAGGEAASLDDLVAHAVARLDAAGLQAPDVVGSSVGGWVALELARRRRARTVVALAPAGLWSPGEAAFARTSVVASAALVRAIDPFVPALMASAPGRTLALGQFVGRPWQLTPQEAVGAARTLASSPGVTSTIDAVADATLEPLETQIPITVAWGTRDLLLRPSQRKRLADVAPSAEVELLPGCGHLPMADDPEAVAALVLRATARSAVPVAA